MLRFDALDRWQKASRKSDAQTAALIGISPSKFSRARRGLQPLPMEDQLALEKITGITPAEWAGFYAEAVKAKTGKGSRAGKKPSGLVGEAA
jgi:DNA-binding transcriptional regulator YdaS (Cro superfamily)